MLSLKEYVAQQKAGGAVATQPARISPPHMMRLTRLTPGGIKNGYINIKPLDDFWPEECRGGNVDRALQHLIVEFEGVRRVATDISGRHKTLRSAHREVKKFVAAHGLRPGDLVEIVRLGKYEYRVRPSAS